MLKVIICPQCTRSYPLLNDYTEVVISAIHAAGGDVLKLIDDGTLAIFHDNDIGSASNAALRAALLGGEH